MPASSAAHTARVSKARTGQHARLLASRACAALTLARALHHGVAARVCERERCSGRRLRAFSASLDRNKQQRCEPRKDSSKRVFNEEYNGTVLMCGALVVVENERSAQRLRGRDFCPGLSFVVWIINTRD